MAGGGDGCETVLAGLFGDATAQASEILAHLGDIGANLGADLDLAAEKFGRDLIAQPVRAGLHQGFGRLGKSEGFEINEEVFFLNPDGKCRLLLGHEAPLSWLVLVQKTVPRRMCQAKKRRPPEIGGRRFGV